MQRLGLALMKIAWVALLLSLLAGCSLFGSSTRHSVVNDSALANAVENALHQELSLQGAQIQVRSMQGVIDLTGRVKSMGMKSRAGLVAASTPGVVQVHNDLLTTSVNGTDSK